MRTKIKRNSKTFLFLFFMSISGIAGGIATTMISSLRAFDIVLMGLGLLLFSFSISETETKLSDSLLIFSFVCYGTAFSWASFLYFEEGRTVTSELFALIAVLTFGFAVYSIIVTIKRRSLSV